MKKIFLVTVLTIFIFPLFVFGVTTPQPGKLPTAENFGTPPSPVETPLELLGILANIAYWVYWIFFIVTVLYVLFAAYDYLTGAGEPEKIKTAHKKLKYAAIAVAVALLAVGFQTIAKNFLENPRTGGTPSQQQLGPPSGVIDV